MNTSTMALRGKPISAIRSNLRRPVHQNVLQPIGHGLRNTHPSRICPAPGVTMHPEATTTQTLISPSKVTETQGRVSEITSAEFSEYLANHNGRITVVDFYTTWCGPCKMIAPVVEAMAEEFAGSVRFAKINLVSSERKFAIDMGVKALPTFHVYMDGQKCAEMVGANPNKLKALVEEHLRSLD